MPNNTPISPPPSLYKFGKRRYLEPLLKDGLVSFAIANTYKDSALTEGQQDDEIARTFLPAAANHVLTIGNGGDAKPITNVTSLKITLNLKGRDGADLKYYIWCASLRCARDLFSEFEADACLRINDPGKFGDRLLVEARRQFPGKVAGIPGCDLYGQNVKYYDEKRLPPTTKQKDLVFLKKSRYMHQAEFRIIFATGPTNVMPDRIELKIGSLEDIAEFCDI